MNAQLLDENFTSCGIIEQNVKTTVRESVTAVGRTKASRSLNLWTMQIGFYLWELIDCRENVKSSPIFIPSYAFAKSVARNIKGEMRFINQMEERFLYREQIYKHFCML